MSQSAREKLDSYCKNKQLRLLVISMHSNSSVTFGMSNVSTSLFKYKANQLDFRKQRYTIGM